MDPAVAEIAADLAAEQAALAAVVEGLPEEEWSRPTPAAGWAVQDQIAHLALGEELAALAATDAGAFFSSLAEAAADIAGYEQAMLARGRALPPAEVVAWWRRAAAAARAAVIPLDPETRLPWVGPPMKPRTFLTARLMETFAHGQDVRDALGLPPDPTPRLRHVAHLGVATRGFSYANRGRTAPIAPVRVDLAGPGGEAWSWGPADAADRIAGPVLDFCLVVTQRRHIADTRLQVAGEAAAEWMRLAQAFGGPPTDGRPPSRPEQEQP
jgi:uncharacterized protein (TIGR03084 family)